MRTIDADALLSELMAKPMVSGAAKAAAMDLVRAAPTIGGWISVKDRLPESNEAVLISVYDKDGKYEYQAIAVRYPCGDWDSTDDYFNQGDGEVKYWMPLPEPPKEGTP